MMTLVLLATACASNATDQTSAVNAPATAAAEATATPRPTPTPFPWDIPQVRPMAIAPANGAQELFIAAGHLISRQTQNSGPDTLRILDPESGEAVAERLIGPLESVTFNGSVLQAVALDERTFFTLDPLTLETLGEWEMPAGASVRVSANQVPGDITIPHNVEESAILAGEPQRSAVSIIDGAGELRTVDIGTSGIHDASFLDEARLLVSFTSLHQLGVVDAQSGEVEQTILSLPSSAAISARLDDNTMLIRFSRLGVVASLDLSTFELTPVDLNQDGPTLRVLFDRIALAQGSLWVASELADGPGSQIVHRIDPTSMTVTARAFLLDAVPFTVTFLGDRGYLIDSDNVLSRFDLAEISEAPIAEPVRPQLPTYEPAEPRDEEEAAVIAVFTTVFDPQDTTGDVSALLEGGEETALVRQQIIALGQAAFPDVEVVVTSVSVNGDAADVIYSFLNNGAPAIFPLSASLERVDGQWTVSRASICRIASEILVPCELGS